MALAPSTKMRLPALCDAFNETMPGWDEDISGARVWDELPKKCQEYVMKIEELCGVECRFLGVGPGRDAIVIKP